MLSNRKITLAQNQLHQQLSWANLKIIHHCSSSFTIIFNVIRTITFITTIISTAYSSIKISTPCQFCLICTTQHQSLLRLQILHNGGKNAAGESCLPLTHQNSSCRHTKPEKHPHGSESSNQSLKNSYMQGKTSCKV
jgi:hypothetical protein